MTNCDFNAINITDMTREQRQKEYRIERAIRSRYSFNEELAIQRQRDTKPEEFAEYFAFCEECKTKVSEQMAREQEKLAQLAAEKAAAESASEPTTE